MPSENSLCVGCGRVMKRSDGIPFRTDTYWRDRVARGLNYASSFIQSRPANSRICLEHFRPQDLKDGTKATGLPCLQLKRLSYWPKWIITGEDSSPQPPGYLFLLSDEQSANAQMEVPSEPLPTNQMDAEEMLDDHESDEDANEVEITEKNKPKFVLVEVEQLRLLFRRCFECGSLISPDHCRGSNMASKISIRFPCSKCAKEQRWDSQTKAKSGHFNGTLQMTSAALLSAIPYSVNLKV